MPAREKPILMSAPMVRAILEGRKTQTRRVVTPQPEFTAASGDSWEWHGGPALARAGYGSRYVHSNWTAVERAMLKVCPFGQPGDRLWVRETWAPMPGGPETKQNGVVYRASEGGKWTWKPSIFMPRWASRITLEITGVRVERLQEITRDSALAEGVDLSMELWPNVNSSDKALKRFPALWESINGKKHPWDSNPFCWVIEFKRL